MINLFTQFISKAMNLSFVIAFSIFNVFCSDPKSSTFFPYNGGYDNYTISKYKTEEQKCKFNEFFCQLLNLSIEEYKSSLKNSVKSGHFNIIYVMSIKDNDGEINTYILPTDLKLKCGFIKNIFKCSMPNPNEEHIVVDSIDKNNNLYSYLERLFYKFLKKHDELTYNNITERRQDFIYNKYNIIELPETEDGINFTSSVGNILTTGKINRNFWHMLLPII
jgi:hypothetical protein